jgi:formylglycine-generating enzyme required for sulfatase activity
MVRIPAGFFSMGAANGAADEQPAHPVALAAFDLDRHEVSNAQYQACVADGRCAPPHSSALYTRPGYFADAEYAGYPVVNVGWRCGCCRPSARSSSRWPALPSRSKPSRSSGFSGCRLGEAI